MGKQLIKIAVILLILLSGVSVYFAHVLFAKREELKGRVQTHEDTVKRVAKFIEVGAESDKRVVIPEDQLRTFKQVPGGPKTMHESLNFLVSAADLQLQNLQQTRVVLASTKATLADTEAKLAATTAALNAARENIGQLTETLALRDNTIAEQKVSFEGFETEKVQMIEDLKTEKEKTETLAMENTTLTNLVAQKDKEIKTLTIRLNPDEGKANLQQGAQGQLVYVSPDWNFVIFKVGENVENFGPDQTFLVNREDQFVGKIKVSSVLRDERLVVAEILNDWQRLPFDKGDTVLF